MKRYKYPRTYHLPFSQGITDDDKVITSLDIFKNQRISISEKKDGECSTLYPDGYTHARSLENVPHHSRSWLKNYWAERCHLLPSNYRICGENVYAKHSIKYTNLDSYFYVFSIWNQDICLSVEDTLEWVKKLDMVYVPILFEDEYNFLKKDFLKTLSGKLDLNKQEGFVIRNSESFLLNQFRYNVAKWVRKNHVDSDKHWLYGKNDIIKNELKKCS